MRLFTGISVEESAIPQLDRLRSAALIDWSPPANFHITTRFIGEWPEARLPELRLTLSTIPWPGTLPLRISGFALLAHVLFAEIHPDPALLELAARTDQVLASLGCAGEMRPYRPHITLARIRRAQAPHTMKLRETMASIVIEPGVGSFQATGFHLYLSRASVYTRLATYS